MAKPKDGFPPMDTGIISSTTDFYRIHQSKYKANAYPPIDFGSMWRFSPIHLKKHGDMQGLYFGDSVSTCLREALFRKNLDNKKVPHTKIAERSCSKIRFRRDISVGFLTKTWLLNTLGYDPVETNDYRACATIATAVFGINSNLDALMFRSYQKGGEANNYVSFSPKVKQTDIEIIKGSTMRLLSKMYANELYFEARASAFTLSDITVIELRKLGLDIK